MIMVGGAAAVAPLVLVRHVVACDCLYSLAFLDDVCSHLYPAAAPLLSLRRELAKVLRCCHRFRLDIVMTKTDAREQAVRTAFSEKDSQSSTHFWARRVHFLL